MEQMKSNFRIKKKIAIRCFIFFVIASTPRAYTQTIEFTPSYGYHFGSKLNYGRNYIEIDDSDQWGLTIGYETFDNTMIEISYVHMSTSVNLRDEFLSPIKSKLADLSADWIMAGGVQYFPYGRLRPFFGGALGIVIFNPSNENRDITNMSFSSETRFAFSFKGGINIMFSDRIGLNLQGNLMFPVNWGGFYVAAGSGGLSSGVSVSSTTLIGGFSGGLVFRIN